MTRLGELQEDAAKVGFTLDSYQGKVKIGLLSHNGGYPRSYFGISECWRGTIKEAEAFVAGASYGVGVGRTLPPGEKCMRTECQADRGYLEKYRNEYCRSAAEKAKS